MEVNLAEAKTYVPEITDQSFISRWPSVAPKPQAAPSSDALKQTWVLPKHREGADKPGKAKNTKSGVTPSQPSSVPGGAEGLDSGGRTPPTQHFEQKLSSNWRHRAANLTHTQSRDVGKNKITTAPRRKPGREHIETIIA